MTANRIVLGASAVFVASLVIVGGLLIAGIQVAMAVDWGVPERSPATQQPTEVYDRDGEPLARFAAEVEREPVEFDEIAPSLRNAVVAKEDAEFWEHRGVDTLSVMRAVWHNVRTGTITQGGSTLTQQYVKNTYVGAERTFTRKAREAMVALQMEKEFSKKEILIRYLNDVYFGEGAYGAEAAAQHYFDKPAAELTLAESATLASVLSAPARLSPRNDPTGAYDRRNRILDRMAEQGLASMSDVATAKDTRIDLAPPPERVFAAPRFVDKVREDLLTAYGSEKLYYGGLRITTTIDLDQQAELAEQVEEYLPADPNIDAGVVALDHTTGDIVATYPGRLDFEKSQVDLALRFGNPTGSAFKPIVLATALELGNTLSTTYPAPSRVTIGDWTVTGSRCPGQCTLLQATVASSNTAFANIADSVGVDHFTEMAHRLGVRAEFTEHDLSQALGTADLSPLDMASAFGTFANNGVNCPARTVSRVVNPDGEPVEPPDPRQPSEEQLDQWAERPNVRRRYGDDRGRCYQAVSPNVAYDVTTALQEVVAEGTGTNAQIERPQAGKTGTTRDAREIWFTGYTPRLTISVYLGGRDEKRPLRTLPGCGGDCVGGDTPALMWADAAETLLDDVPPGEFTDPGEQYELPEATPSPQASPSPGPSPEASPSPQPSPEPSPSPQPSPSPEPRDDSEDDESDGDDVPDDSSEGDYPEYGDPEAREERERREEERRQDEDDDDDDDGGLLLP